MFAIKACLYCVFTERCNQCNCERVFLTEMSVLFLPAWVQVGTCWIFFFPVFLISKCKCIPWFVSASVYTSFFYFFFFFIFLVFPGSNAKKQGLVFRVRRQLRSMSAALIIKRENSLFVSRASRRAHEFKKKTMASLAVGARRQCSPRPRVHLVEVKKKKVSAAPEDLDVVSESFWSHSCSARGIIFVNWRCMHAQSPQHSLRLILSMCLPFGSDYFIYGTRKTNRYHVSPWRRSFRLRHADRLRH